VANANYWDLHRSTHRVVRSLRNLVTKPLGFPRSICNLLTRPSSISDEGAYRDFCRRAASDEATFGTFRRSPVYTRVLEHVTESLGRAYLDTALKQSPGLDQYLEKFRSNDSIGTPKTHRYAPYGEFSPTTLRYVKVLSDLQSLFGSLDGLRIVEIGVGYGGQCKVIHDVYRVASYTLIDLAPCLELVRAYLNRLQVPDVSLRTAEELDPKSSYDLAISNYAFSECRRDVQDLYLDVVLRRSTRGYVTCNAISDWTFNSYSKRDLLLSITGSNEAPEAPLTYRGNFVWSWDHSVRAIEGKSFAQ
jgi:putative sugar O-methyltransferase